MLYAASGIEPNSRPALTLLCCERVQFTGELGHRCGKCKSTHHCRDSCSKTHTGGLVSQDGSQKLYPNEDIEAFEKREAEQLIWVDRDHRCV